MVSSGSALRRDSSRRCPGRTVQDGNQSPSRGLTRIFPLPSDSHPTETLFVIIHSAVAALSTRVRRSIDRARAQEKHHTENAQSPLPIIIYLHGTGARITAPLPARYDIPVDFH
jgi:hypothetical protein